MNTINKYTGKAANNHTFLPGNGFVVQEWVPQLSHNGCDIESQLFGIGSTNLETYTIPAAPSLKQMRSLSIIKTAIFLPEPLNISTTERNNYLN
jgi:hypothetical protein